MKRTVPTNPKAPAPRVLPGAVFPLLLVLAGILAAGACAGWSTRPLVLEGCNKIYVPYFKNDTFYRRLEQELTRAVIARINERPDLLLVDEKSAELIINGTIIDYRLSVLSEDREDRVIEGRATTVVRVRIERASNGEVLKEKELRDSQEYLSALGEGPEDSRARSFELLSRKITALLEEGF